MTTTHALGHSRSPRDYGRCDCPSCRPHWPRWTWRELLERLHLKPLEAPAK